MSRAGHVPSLAQRRMHLAAQRPGAGHERRHLPAARVTSRGGRRHSSVDVHALQRLALMGIVSRHWGHSLVVGVAPPKRVWAALTSLETTRKSTNATMRKS